MKISPRATALTLTAVALLAISACGSSESNSGATPRTKNAAIRDANGNWVQANPSIKATTTTIGPKATTTSICVGAPTSAQNVTAIIEAQLISEGIATATAQSAAAAAAGNIERAGLLTKDNCVPSSTTVPTSLAPTTLAPTSLAPTTLAPKATITIPAGCNPAVWVKSKKCYK